MERTVPLLILLTVLAGGTYLAFQGPLHHSNEQARNYVIAAGNSSLTHLSLADGTARIGDNDLVTALDGGAGCGLVTVDTAAEEDAVHVYYLKNQTVITPGSDLKRQIHGQYVSHGCSIMQASQERCSRNQSPYRICQTGDGPEALCDLSQEGNTVLDHRIEGNTSMLCSEREWKQCNATTEGNTVRFHHDTENGKTSRTADTTTQRTTLTRVHTPESEEESAEDRPYLGSQTPRTATCRRTDDGYTWTFDEPRISWEVVERPSAPLKDIDRHGTTVIAVGSNGTALHRNGTDWAVRQTPADSYLYEVEVVDSDAAWAVGHHGTVLRWNGQQWQHVSLPMNASTYRLTAIEVENDQVWITGGRITERGTAVRDWQSHGILLYREGQDWTSSRKPLFITDISIEDGQGVAVGFLGSVYDVQGSDLTPVSQNLTDIRNFIEVAQHGDPTWITSGSPTHSGGVGWFIRRDGSTFTVANRAFHGVKKYYEIVHAGDTWYGAGKFRYQEQPSIRTSVVRWNGSVWRREPMPSEITSFENDATTLQGYLMGIAMRNATHGYAVGEAKTAPGGGLILKRSVDK